MGNYIRNSVAVWETGTNTSTLKMDYLLIYHTTGRHHLKLAAVIILLACILELSGSKSGLGNQQSWMRFLVVIESFS